MDTQSQTYDEPTTEPTVNDPAGEQAFGNPAFHPSVGFPVELDTGEVVRVVDKQPHPQAGTTLVTEDGRTVVDDYDTLSAAYEVELDADGKIIGNPKAEQMAAAARNANGVSAENAVAINPNTKSVNEETVMDGDGTLVAESGQVTEDGIKSYSDGPDAA